MAKIRGFERISPAEWRFLHNNEVREARAKAEEYEGRNFNFENLEHYIEEFLRQWIVRELIETYGYAENSLWIANISKRNANVVVKDTGNKSVALVAARRFGETDYEFEQACQELQSDLEMIETVRFGLVTDGRRVSFLAKSADDSIGDFKTIADFPTAAELQTFLDFDSQSETDGIARQPEFPAIAQKFQLLPPPIAPEKPAPFKLAEPAAPKVKAAKAAAGANGTGRKVLALTLGLIFLFIAGRWYWTSNADNAANTQSPAPTTVQKVKPDESPAAPNAVDPPTIIERPTIVSTAKPASAPNNAPRAAAVTPPASRPEKSTARPRANSDGKIRLSNQEILLMQSRPAANPNARNIQPRVFTQPAPTAPPDKRRTIIKQPYTRPN